MKKLENLMKEETKGQIVPIPKTMNEHLENYQESHKLRHPNESKKKKPDLVVKMMLLGLDGFIAEYKELDKQRKDYLTSKK